MKKLIALSCAATLYCAGAVFAEPIPIQNHSFENAGLAAGAWSNCIDVICGQADPEWWINPDPTSGASNTNTAFSEVINGFTADGIAHAGIDTDQPFMSLEQDTGVAVTPNTLYTLTVAVGNRNTGFSPVGSLSGIALFGGDAFAFGGEQIGLATFAAGDELGGSQFQDVELVVETGDTPPVGNLWVSLINLGVDENLTPVGRSHFDNVRLDATSISTGPLCDFDGDDICNNIDIDLLGKEIIAGTHNPDFDMNADAAVNLADQDEWRSVAATENGFGAPYLNGDADLDGSVGAPDLNAVALSWNTTPDPWSDGDFNADGNVNAQDLNLLALNWQQSIPAAASVPEPATGALLLISAFGLMSFRRRGRRC